MARAMLTLLVLLITVGCERRPDNVPVVVSVVGGRAGLVEPSQRDMTEPQRVLVGATAQGLVRFDANGQVEPGLAERWIMIDDGTSYIFRLGEAEWADGSRVTAGDVVAVLNRAIAEGSANRLQPFLANINEAVEMTPQIVELRLRRPVPNLLQLLAQPELAIIRARGLTGSGPFRVAEREGGSLVLSPVFDPVANPDAAEPQPEDLVRLRGERAALAIARFAALASDLVLGGSYLDWPLLGLAELPPRSVRTDPAAGLFGFAVIGRQGFLASSTAREAVAMAIDRPRLLAQFRQDWAPAEAILPEPLDSAAPPAEPSWRSLNYDIRLALARTRVNNWAADQGAPAIRIALPDGPGANLVWGAVAADLRAAGMRPQRVGMRAAADLILIDLVAPTDTARWYLTSACVRCADDAATLIDAARDATTTDAKRQRLAEADAALTADAAFIPIARPLRWSLVAPRLRQWQGNARGWHPLNRLRADPN
ncbi:ABC transporter substrate-binding protein [Sphingomonas sp. SFZ2018-12]|uniref:ABC transporter substrate-binding protein n=1 Tax=Sphingomonas sp. SFZ2018-12 TaxID=2683197 RepID=UPI001F0D5943|nr:ABC transporter substrate-binding protein [Sphingomonas sp. SFZ2018-12]MCH4894819.1 ABC transporter substrate-binding protein [Sphingomonas sp. SFZ2018-12]